MTIAIYKLWKMEEINKFAGKAIVVVVVKVAEIEEKSCSFSNRGKS